MKKAKHLLTLGVLLLFGAAVFGQPTITNLSLGASSPEIVTVDQLIATYTNGASVVETAAAWYKDGVPVNTLYLPFEAWEDPNALLDFSGNSNNAAYPADVFAEPEWQGNYGYNGTGGFTFDGDAYLIVEDALPLDGSYTKTAWVYKDANSTGFRNIMSSAIFEPNNHSFKIDNLARLNAGHSEGSAVVMDADTLNDDQWYFVAVSFDYATGDMVLYKDGLEVDRGVVDPGLLSVTDDTILIGSMAYNWFWYGNIDEPRVFNTALTSDQVASLYTNGNNYIAPSETSGGEEWFVDITPFSFSEVGGTYRSNTITIGTIVVSPIPDQTVAEGSPFVVIDLDDYMVDYEYADNQVTWAATGNTDLTVTISSSTHFATITVPDVNWYGTEDITFTASDPTPDSDATTVTFTVTNVNDAPVLNEIGAQDVDEDNSLTGLVVSYSDADTDAHTITVESDDGNVTIANLSGVTSGSTYDLVPAADWNGTANITVTVTDDGTGDLEDSETYIFTVNPINDAPELTDVGNQNTTEGTNVVGLEVDYSDVDVSDIHVITVVSDNTNVTVANLSGNDIGSTYDLVPAADWNGTANITVTVTDDGTGPMNDTETYILTVSNVNDTPVLTDIGSQSTDEDVALTGLVVAFTDIDGTDAHTITVTSNEPNITVANLSGNVTGSTYDLVPAADWNGIAQITVTVTDNGLGALNDSEIYTLTVDPANDAPTAVDLSSNSTDENVPVGTVIGLLSSADVDADDTHVYTFISDGGFLSGDNDAFIIVGDTLKTNAEINYEEGDVMWILVQSDDGSGGLVSQNLTIYVTDLLETGVREFENDLSLRVYPVPAVEFITVEVDNPDNKDLLLEIFSDAGKLVHSERTIVGNTIYLNEFSDGMYILRVSGENVFQTRKIVLNR